MAAPHRWGQQGAAPPTASVAGASVAAQLLEQIRRHPPRVAEERPVDHAPPVLETASAPFVAGDRVLCVPFGYGTIVAVQEDDGRLMLDVLIDELGSTWIDPRKYTVVPIARERREWRGR